MSTPRDAAPTSSEDTSGRGIASAAVQASTLVVDVCPREVSGESRSAVLCGTHEEQDCRGLNPKSARPFFLFSVSMIKNHHRFSFCFPNGQKILSLGP